MTNENLLAAVLVNFGICGLSIREAKNNRKCANTDGNKTKRSIKHGF
jgi:hypothetical protein